MTRSILIGFLVAFAAILFVNRSEAIFGADSSGYVNLAHLLARGETSRTIPAMDRLACGDCEPMWFVPLGFLSRRDGRSMASIYPAGLPLHLALAARLGGWEHAPFFVSPIAALLLLLVTYRLGRSLHSELAGTVAAVVMGLCAVLLFQAQQAMSDVLAATWSAAAIAAAVESRRHSSLALMAGFCFGMAVLVRPTSLLLVAPLAFALPWHWRRTCLFVGGGLPVAVFLGWYNRSAFGSLWATGYGAIGLSRDFALHYFLERALHHGYWTFRQFGPIVIACAIAALFMRGIHRRDRVMLAAWFASFYTFYSFYLWYDTWWYTRFLLPAYPAIAVASGITFARAIEQVRATRLAVAFLIVSMAWQLRQTSHFAVLYTDEDQHRARVPVEWSARALPPRSLVFSMEYSGALLYYTSHAPVRWDIPSSDHVLPLLEKSAVPTYALLMPHEEEAFQAKYGPSFRRLRHFESATLYAMKRPLR